MTFTVEMDASGVLDALTALGPAAQDRVNDASAETAAAVVQEAQSRLRRQLGPQATGQTVASIAAQPARSGNGSVVFSSGRDPFPNLPLWIEKGTRRGKPGSSTQPARPFFYVSVELERGAHYRRLSEALQLAIDDQGLGA